jgi:hypothetical protein
LTTAPGVGNSWIFSFGAQGASQYGSFSSGGDGLCTISGSSKSCNGTLVLVGSFSSSDQISITADSTGSPVNTKAAWSVRCIAP